MCSGQPGLASIEKYFIIEFVAAWFTKSLRRENPPPRVLEKNKKKNKKAWDLLQSAREDFFGFPSRKTKEGESPLLCFFSDTS